MNQSCFIFSYILNKMRKQLNLQDYEIPSLQWNVTVGGLNSKIQYGFNTDYQTKKVEIQTVIVHGNKQTFATQINQRIINRQLQQQRKKQQAQSNQNNQAQNEEQESQESIKKLDRFIRKVTPLMEKQLNENLPLYEKLGLQNDKGFFKKETQLSYTLENVDNFSEDGLVISDLAWNSTGVLLGAVYSQPEHQTACSHKSMICLWSLYKRNFKPNKPQVIFSNNCLSCIQFHPKRPSVFVCGTYSGEILLYDLSKKTQQLLAKTLVDDYFHRDVISQLSWWPFKAPGKSEANYNVLSLGTDGKILLWEVPNIALGDDAPPNRVKALFRNPIKGFSILRKKEGVIIPVSALNMLQTKSNRNVFVVGSEGGSLLKASLTPINHYMNNECKILLDLQKDVKYRKEVYPFLLNLPPKQFREIRDFIDKKAMEKGLKQIDNVAQILQLKPELKYLYPNAITFAFQPLAYPISSLYINQYGLMIVNGCDGYARVYHENRKEHLESFEQGYQWGWVNNSTRIAGFMGQQFLVADWLTGQTLWSVPVGQGYKWRESGSNTVAIICEDRKIKIVELGDRILRQEENSEKALSNRLKELGVN